ncbi:hypothetical protein [Citrobacter sp. JGM124]|uniref:hypothetical protein n=1 Tax=Citrobacter sp. JGM124 TaxID=2799789 RepID=UPI001BA65E01|nr:hypothetical protein [Citrobacter sp. JGM124]MBS0848002.1 hypothetical protein [Citrobacter sp. JGM124]
MDRQYNNEVTPELLAAMDQSSLTAEQLAEMDDEGRVLSEEQDEYIMLHPVTVLWRKAVSGILTGSGLVNGEVNDGVS